MALGYIVAAVGVAVVSLPISAANAGPPPECQKALEAAVLKLTTSGPMRALDKRKSADMPETLSATVFVPPDNIQLRQSSDGSVLDRVVPSITMMGANIFYGIEQTVDDQKIEGAIYEYAPLSQVADPFRYYAIACSGPTITFEYQVPGGNDPDINVRLAAIEKSRARDAKYNGGKPGKEPVGTLTLDASGRPAAILYDTTGTQGWPDAWSIAFTYDPTLKIVAPK